jgi:hypothetical protein
LVVFEQRGVFQQPQALSFLHALAKKFLFTPESQSRLQRWNPREPALLSQRSRLIFQPPFLFVKDGDDFFRKLG